MKIFRTLFSAALISAAVSGPVVLSPVYGQEPSPGIGSFDLEKVNDDVASGADTALAGAASVAGYTGRTENYAIVLLRITGSLVIITAVILCIAWAVRKIGVAGVSKVGGGSNMDVIETLYLGQNRGAALMRVGDTVYLVGHTPENIVLLEKIEGDKAIGLIASSKSGGTAGFKDVLNNFMGKMKKS
ncbi:MAG: flagellar biosynthetic protein FliO [Chitinispirillia bacterium]|nr:flagellar biosynthetic protein FliO [Chitinispirillia bacterium]MCL2242349.1 flagellar biosynthetic protein FliO [Chitinispirillia bacterium]